VSKTGTLESLIVEVDPVAEYRARQRKSWRAYRTGILFLLYLHLIGPFIVLWKPWDLKRRFAALRLKIHDAKGTYFQPRETARALAMRRGDCNRCGACCQILYRCPYLKETAGGFLCGIYESRPDQCATFPHNLRSLELLSQMGVSCSYAFASEEAAPRLVDQLAKRKAA
jgi:hypothetical protein